MERGNLYDFHVHTTYSDGVNNPGEIVRIAKSQGLNTIAITDHYTLAGVDYAKQIAGKDINIVSGIELSAQSPKGKRLHIIGLYVDKAIYSLVDYYESKRQVLVEETICKLRKNKYKIKMEDVIANSRDKSSIGRYDIAITLACMNYSTNPKQAYEEILLNKRIFVEREKLSAEEIIKAIIEANGVPILAHPNSCKLLSSTFEERLEHLKKMGLVGVEVYTPYIVDERRENLLRLCEKLELLPSVGSDFHGISGRNVVIGHGIESNMIVDSPSILRSLRKARNRQIN